VFSGGTVMVIFLTAVSGLLSGRCGLRQAKIGRPPPLGRSTVRASRARSAEKLVHDFGAASQFGHDHLPVDGFGCRRALVANEDSYVLERHSARGQQ
jgi:hypothetical protein